MFNIYFMWPQLKLIPEKSNKWINSNCEESHKKSLDYIEIQEKFWRVLKLCCAKARVNSHMIWSIIEIKNAYLNYRVEHVCKESWI